MDGWIVWIILTCGGYEKNYNKLRIHLNHLFLQIFVLLPFYPEQNNSLNATLTQTHAACTFLTQTTSLLTSVD